MCVWNSRDGGKHHSLLSPGTGDFTRFHFNFYFFLVAYDVLDFTNVYLVNVNNALELANQSEHYIGLKTQAN